MACNVAWTATAEKDLDGIVSYIALDLSNPGAASSLLDGIEEAIQRIEAFPELYEISNLAPLAKRNLRACFVRRYVILYSYNKESGATIARIFSTLQDYAAVITRA